MKLRSIGLAVLLLLVAATAAYAEKLRGYVWEVSTSAIVVEGPRDHVREVVAGNPTIERLVRNRWIWLACLDAESDTLYELRSSGFVPHTAEHALAEVAGESAAWYQGKRGFLAPVAIVQEAPVATHERGSQG